jgi:hypothetical protein
MTTVPTERTVYVNAKTGNDTTNNGQSSSTPYKTITKALKAVASPGPIPVLDIEVANGVYNAANGEVFPLVVPSVTGLVINGSTYGVRGTSKGAFIDGAGEDTVYEKAVGGVAKSSYTSIVIPIGAQVSMTNMYVGASHPALPGAAVYDAVDVLGQLTGTTSAFNPSIVRVPGRLNGVLVAGGTLSCASCSIAGRFYAIATFAIPATVCGGSSGSGGSSGGSGSGNGSCPILTLTGPQISGQGSIIGLEGIKTDGTATIVVSNQTFSGESIAFSDDYKPFLTGIVPVPADFGQGGGTPQSTGGNIFLGARTSVISLGLPGDEVDAYGDTWNQNSQGSGSNGQFRSEFIFAPGAAGTNVTIASAANGAKVRVGPFKHPTPTPSASPSGSPSGSPSASPTASPT